MLPNCLICYEYKNIGKGHTNFKNPLASVAGGQNMSSAKCDPYLTAQIFALSIIYCATDLWGLVKIIYRFPQIC